MGVTGWKGARKLGRLHGVRILEVHLNNSGDLVRNLDEFLDLDLELEWNGEDAPWLGLGNWEMIRFDSVGHFENENGDRKTESAEAGEGLRDEMSEMPCDE